MHIFFGQKIPMESSKYFDGERTINFWHQFSTSFERKSKFRNPILKQKKIRTVLILEIEKKTENDSSLTIDVVLFENQSRIDFTSMTFYALSQSPYDAQLDFADGG